MLHPAPQNTPQDSQVAPARLYDGNFLLALTSQTCFVIANTLLAHYARWIEFLEGDLSQVGWIMGVGAAAGLLLRPWMAQWINQVGAKRMWGIGYLVFSGASLANLVLYDLGPSIYLVRAAVVLGAAIVFASGLTYISQIAPEPRRTEAIGILGVGGFLGMLVGPFMGDIFLGGVRERHHFATLFIVAGAANIVPFLLLSLLRSPTHVRAPKSLRIRDFVSTVRTHWPGTILLVDLVFGVCMTAPFVFVASFIDDAPLDLPGISELGFFFWCYAGLAIVVRVWLRRLPERIGARRVLMAGMLFMGVGMFAFCGVGVGAPWLLAVPALLTGIGHSLMFHTMTSLTVEPFPLALRGTGSALALLLLDLGTLIGSPILGLVGDFFGYGALFATIGTSCLLVALAYYRFG